MRESGYYPAGAEHDPNAPYNQSEPEKMFFDVDMMQTFHIQAKIASIDYKGYMYNGDIEDDFKAQYMQLGEAAQVAIEALRARLKAVMRGRESRRIAEAIDTLKLFIDAECDIEGE